MNEDIKRKCESLVSDLYKDGKTPMNNFGVDWDKLIKVEKVLYDYILNGEYNNKLIVHVYDPETKEFNTTGWCSKPFTGLKIICPFFNGIPEEHYSEFAKTGNVYYILTNIGKGKFHLLYHWDKELFLREYYEKGSLL